MRGALILPALMALCLLPLPAPAQAAVKAAKAGGRGLVAEARPPAQDEAALEALAAKWKAVSPKYTPDLRQWKVEILTPLGGWMTTPPVNAEVRLVDPLDPNPPKRGLLWQAYDEDNAPTETWVPDAKLSLEQRQARNAWNQVEQKRNQWRQNRRVEIWFNGRKYVQTVSVGQAFWVQLQNAEGENRLEVGFRGSGSWQLRSWWTWATRDRLQVRVIEEGAASAEEGDSEGEWYGGGDGDIRVVEPDGTVAQEGNTPSGGRKRWHGYSHGDPLPGTYTVRWQPRVWEEEEGAGSQAKPRRVAVEVLLDAGTDRERRWRFEQLVMPGRAEVVLGSFDVED